MPPSQPPVPTAPIPLSALVATPPAALPAAGPAPPPTADVEPDAARPRVHVITHGCQMNEYDARKMADVLGASHGYERSSLADADVVLLNTCSIREKAQEKVFSELGRLRAWKAARPGRVIGVGGCVASQEGDAITRRAPQVDLVFGPQTLHRLPQLLDSHRQTRRAAVDISFPEIEKFDHLPAPRAEGPLAFVSVMEGCSKFCTYCVVPYTRGAEVSRPLDDVLLECVQLVDQGVREITLLGQNVNAYRGAMAGGGSCDLALLIHYLGRVPGLERIRFTTSHPAEFTDALADAFAHEPKLAGYLHLPAQSGSDRILAMMKRGYTADQFLARIERVKKARPGISLSSDFIVGFPSETAADHQATMDLIDACGFDGAFSFIYSARPGTPAAALRDGVDDDTKRARLSQLQERIHANDMAYKGGLVGSRQPVLVERRSTRDRSEWAGRVTANRMVNFPVAPGLGIAPGDIVDVRITGVTPNALRGELVAPAATSPRAAEDQPA